MPLGWWQDRYYPNNPFRREEGPLPGAAVTENTFSLRAGLPA